MSLSWSLWWQSQNVTSRSVCRICLSNLCCAFLHCVSSWKKDEHSSRNMFEECGRSVETSGKLRGRGDHRKRGAKKRSEEDRGMREKLAGEDERLIKRSEERQRFLSFGSFVCGNTRGVSSLLEVQACDLFRSFSTRFQVFGRCFDTFFLPITTLPSFSILLGLLYAVVAAVL